MTELCKFCQYQATDECLDCAVIFDREYKKGNVETLVLHRNFIEKPMGFNSSDKSCFGHQDKDSPECIACEVAVECYESKIGGNTLTSQHRGDT